MTQQVQPEKTNGTNDPAPAQVKPSRLKHSCHQITAFLRQNRLEVVVCIVAGALLACGLPSVNAWPVGFFAVALFLWSLRGKTARTGFGLGLIFGTVYFYAAVFWLNSIWFFAPPPQKILAFGAVFLLSLYSGGFYMGLFGALGSLLWRKRPLIAPLSLAGLWVIFEWIRSLGPLGFSWAFLAHTQSANLPFIQMADLGGTYLISFVLLAINALLVQLLAERKCSKSRLALRASAFLLLIIAPYLYGMWRMGQTWTSDKPVNVGISQPGVEQIKKYASYAHPDERIAAALQQEIELLQFVQIRRIHEAAPETQLYVLPESAFTQRYFERDTRLQGELTAISRDVNAAIFFGADNDVWGEGEDPEKMFVAAWLVDPNKGVWPNAYNKMRLVPFGESLPVFDKIPFLKDAVLGMATFDPGENYTLFSVEGIPFACGICFESASADQMRQIVGEGAQFLTIITNDAWYYHRFWQLDKRGAPQHDAMSTFRAIENRRWLARSANTGISRIVDPAGRTVKQAPREQMTFITGKVYGLSGQTPYTRWGNWFVVVAFLLLAAGLWRTGTNKAVEA